MKVMGIAADALKLLVEIDYTLLRDTKRWLCLTQDGANEEGSEHCEVLLSLLDAIQDFAVDRMGKPEREVFDLEEEQ